jgi:hypothetical protein
MAARDASTDAALATAAGSGAGVRWGADGVLAVFLGHAAAHRPHGER